MRVAVSAKVAVVGCGYWGRNLIRNFRELGSLVAVCDGAEDGRSAAREIAPEVPVFEDFEKMLQHEGAQGVVLATPAETHYTLAKAALEAGKDVFVEKPLALNLRQGMEMKSLADRLGRVLMVGHLLEYHPAVLKLRELLSAGDLGRLDYIYSHRLNFGKIRTEENALWSFAPHDIAVILRLVGELPIEVTCSGGSYVTPNLSDVTVSCLHFRTGVRAHIFVSWLNPFKEQKLVVVGNRRMAVFNDVAKTDKLVLYDQRVDLSNRQPVLRKGEMQSLRISEDEPLRRECEHFLECIRTRQLPTTDASSGVNVLRVLEACQVSLQLNGRPVVLSEIN
jgi:UDP-2-acetamido-3-amino-2,3-dideoxy-glucuronate N-acetyltransferase